MLKRVTNYQKSVRVRVTPHNLSRPGGICGDADCELRLGRVIERGGRRSGVTRRVMSLHILCVDFEARNLNCLSLSEEREVISAKCRREWCSTVNES